MNLVAVAIAVAILAYALRKPVKSELGEFHPVHQTVAGYLPDGRPIGNCFPACVASILGLQLHEVPFFSTETQQKQLDDANRWLKPRGYQLVMLPNTPNHKHPKDTYYIIRGLSPRMKGQFHMCVGKNGKLVHDPHPENTGIIGEAAHFIYFVKI